MNWMSLPALMLFSQALMAEVVCEQASKLHYVSGWEDVESVQRIDQALTPGGIVSCTYYPDREQRLNVLVAREEGVFEGVEYELQYADGSAIIQGQAEKSITDSTYRENWRLHCEEPEAKGPVACRLQKSDLVVEKSGDTVSVVIGDDYADESTVLARVTGEKAITATAADGFSADQSRRLMAQLQAGDAVDIRFHHRDRPKPTDITVSLFGFNQAVAIMQRVSDLLSNGVSDVR